MKMKVEQGNKLEDGSHNGTIEDVTERTTEHGYLYLDIHVKVTNANMILRASYPAKISPITNLGKLLTRFGYDLTQTEIELDSLKGKNCSFLTKTEKGIYAAIITDSLKPDEPEEIVVKPL